MNATIENLQSENKQLRALLGQASFELSQMRNACAAFARVLVRHNLADQASDEGVKAGVMPGFAVRAMEKLDRINAILDHK